MMTYYLQNYAGIIGAGTTSSMYTITNTHSCTHPHARTHVRTHARTHTHTTLSLTIGAGSPFARQVKVAVLPSDTVVLTGS